MSSSYQYHRPGPFEVQSDDSGSDLELDLEELDPVSTANNSKSDASLQQLRRSREERRLRQQRRGRIALRSLRTTGMRGTTSTARERDGLEGAFEEDSENLDGSPDDNYNESTRRNTTGSMGSFDDNAPLLQQGPSRRGRLNMGEDADASTLGTKARLLSFMSGVSQSNPAHEALERGDEVEGEAERDPASTRLISVGSAQSDRFPPNAVSNAKYTSWNFLPLTLYNEFSFFFNLYFLLVALSQIIPALRIGYLSTYIVPLAFVLSVTLGKEAFDDLSRRRRDREANAENYTVIRIDNSLPRTKTGRERTRTSGASASLEQTARIEHGNALSLDSSADIAFVSEITKKSRDLKVGDILKMGKDQRVPADVVILKSVTNETTSVAVPLEGRASPNPTILGASASTDISAAASNNMLFSGGNSKYDPVRTASLTVTEADGAGETFIRTDQLDGETDWKLRIASPLTQTLNLRELSKLLVTTGKPDKRVNDFTGIVELLSAPASMCDNYASKSKGLGRKENEQPLRQESFDSNNTKSAPLSIDNTAWANTVLASNSTIFAVVVYTGRETKQALSTSPSRSKTGLLEYEINALTKILCILTLSISIILVGLEGFESTPERKWYVAIMRFLVLFSTIIPISLRVNLDMGKTVYAWFIERDQGIKGALVRTSTIPEELGRVEYLLTDKTGTLTQNEMELKKIHVGTVSYANEAMDEVASYIRQGFSFLGPTNVNEPSTLITPSSTFVTSTAATTGTRTRREIGSRVRDIVLALALCHNVTPTSEVEEDGKKVTTYQASSPDEIAIIRWVENVGLRLVHRDRKSMTLQSVETSRVVVRVQILDIFPFTSDSKRMGVIVRFLQGSETSILEGDSNKTASEIWFYQKGADAVMSSIVTANDWLDEETANMAREGLRTLVVGRKKLSAQHYEDFTSEYKNASMSLQGREAGMFRVIKDFLERDLELLGVTGVEDKLQKAVKPSLELLRNAGIKIWMLTGDKVETARCVAVSAKLVARGQYVHTIAKLKRKDLAQDSLDILHSKTDACLLIDGESLALFLTHFPDAFISMAVRLPSVVACRCSPTQKAEVAKLIRKHTKKRVCCIGDGGNDVSMIQAADVGVGIVGKEGRQASLAADFSIEQFYHLTKLLVWHGRNSYKRSAKLAQFVIHRGLIISVCQTMFSIASEFEPNALYKDWLLVGYATVYTMAPVFSLVLDKDVDEGLANLYPELYRELTEGRSLSYRTFFIWVFVSIYQGGIIQGLSQILVEVSGRRMVAVSFTVLVINELIMVAFEITTWHPLMVFSLIGTALVYFGSVPFLGRYFDLEYVITLGFLWRVVAISAISLIPPYAAKLLRRTLKPPSYRKVQGL